MVKADKQSDQRWMWRVLVVSAVFHVCAAFFSQGFHSADEYFQILEFAAFKLGMTPRAVLAVEYGEKMRPWLLPGFVTAVVSGLKALGMHNPHHWAVVLRLISGALGWASSVAISLCVPRFFQTQFLRRLAWVAAGFLWFVPALHVRPSSEAWSGAWMVIAWALLWSELVRKQPLRFARAVLAGACAGLAFESRFQAGVMIAPVAGVLIWQLWQRGAVKRRESAVFFGGLALGFLALFCLGRAIDAWGYGEWCLSPWNYLHFNLIRDEVNRFGVAPFWDVFRMANTEAWPILGFLLVLSWCVAWVRDPLSLLTAATLPLFAVHCLIAHKELRFFFPITYFSPLLLGVALRGWGEHWSQRAPGRALLIVLAVWNGMGFLASSFLPISRNVLFFRAAWDLGVTEIASPDPDPLDILGTATFFYRPPGWVMTSLRNAEDLTRWVGMHRQNSARPRYVFRAGLELPEWMEQNSKIRCDRVYLALPESVVALHQKGYLPRANVWSLWSCYRVSI